MLNALSVDVEEYFHAAIFRSGTGTTASRGFESRVERSVDLLLSTIERGRLPASKLMPVTLVVRETTPSRKPARKKDGHS